MAVYTESSYENAFLTILESMGWTYVYGPEIERDYKCPLYEEELENALYALNSHLPDAAIQEALLKIKRFENADLVDKNARFMDYIQNGIEVSYVINGEKRYGLVRLVDYSNPRANSFVAANQWTFIENAERRPDIILFVNGLPVVLIELKSPSSDATDADDGYKQIRNYMQDIPSLFIYNCICMFSDMLTTRAGTITSGRDRYMNWKTVDGDYESTKFADYRTPIEGMFAPERLIDIIKNFICFSDEGVTHSKILAGYHQYFAVRKAIESTKRAVVTDGKGGVMWHTQGSGKSLSMVFYAHLLQEALQSPTIVVITDRNDLDGQLFGQFNRCSGFLRQTPIQADTRKHLKQLLSQTKVNGIFFTTIQKFEESDEPLSLRKNIIVIADEAHRSQYGTREIVEQKKKQVTGKVKVGQAGHMRASLPNATYIGFTGTPISQKDKDTRAVFGDYIDVYDMTQAVEDGATRPVYYESRVIKLKLNEETLKEIDELYNKMSGRASEEVIQKSKASLARMDEVLGHDKTVTSLVTDILEHYEDCRAGLLTGKAMIVAYSRPVAMKIYDKILELRPDWKDKVAVVMTESNQDPEEWRAIIGNKQHREELARKFKDDSSPLKIVIVVDMWLTGFDVPSLATMYVFKPMAGHNLMQAIARVNRVFGDKEGGLVVDYIGIANAFKEAMSDYTYRDRDNFGDMDIAKQALEKFIEKLEVCRGLMHGFGYARFFEGTDAERSDLISGAVNFLAAPERKGDMESYMKEAFLLKQALSLCSSVAQKQDRIEAAFFEAVRVLLMRLTMQGGGRISLPELNKTIGELLKQSVKSEGVTSLFSDISQEFSLFDPKFLEQIKNMEHKNIAVEMLKKLLKEQIRGYRRINVVKSKKFSDMLQELVNRYINGLISNEEVIEALLKMARDIADNDKVGKDMGLTTEELAFYDALTKPGAVKDFYTNDQLVELTKELTETLRKNRTVDWQRLESARANMRFMVKKLLKKYKYPPEGMEDAVKTVIDQCELWADNSEMEN